MIAELNRMVNEVRSQNYQPKHWEMTRFFFSIIQSELNLPGYSFVDETNAGLGSPTYPGKILGLPVVIVDYSRPDVTLIGIERTPGGES